MNKAIITGNLTRDPEKRITPNGVTVCTFTVAVQRRFTNQRGEREADFLPVVCWRALADACWEYLHKGSKVGVVGSLQTRSYEANDGGRRYVTEIIAGEVDFLTSARKQDQREAGGPDLIPADDEELPPGWGETAEEQGSLWR